MSRLAGLLAVALGFALWDAASFGLTDLDEGFYASVSAAMARSGDWITPRLYGEPWFEKPAGLYWLMAVSIKLFGASEAAARLPSILSFGLIAILLWAWGERRLSPGAGQFAALVFLSSPLVFVLGRLALTDMALVLFFLIGLISLWETAKNPFWCVPLGIATGAATLMKGPMALFLIGVLILASLPLLRSNGFQFRYAIAALLTAIATAAPWYFAVYAQHGGDFFNEFIVKQNLSRLAGGDKAHAPPNFLVGLPFYPVVLLLGMAPWADKLGALWRQPSNPVEQFLWRWALIVFALFTISGTKLPHYILPTTPALALLIGACLARNARFSSDVAVYGQLAMGLLWVFLSVGLAVFLQSPWIALLAALPYVRFAISRTATATVMLAIACIGFHVGLTAYDARFLAAPRELARSVPPAAELGVFDVKPGLPSLDFYVSGRAVPCETLEEALALLNNGGYCLTKGRRPEIVAPFVREEGEYALYGPVQ